MEMPHERWGVVYCPKPCERWKDFWIKSTMYYTKFTWQLIESPFHPELSPCEVDETLSDAIIITQENFRFEPPPIIRGEELKRMIDDWLRSFEIVGISDVFWRPTLAERRVDVYTTVEVTVSDEMAQIYFMRRCPVFFILKKAEEFGVKFKDMKEVFDAIFQLYTLDKDRLAEERTFYEHVVVLIKLCRAELGFRGKGTKKQLKKLAELFKGILLPEEMDHQQKHFLDFIKERFPNWQHLT